MTINYYLFLFDIWILQTLAELNYISSQDKLKK